MHHHEDTKSQSSPLPEAVESIASQIVDAAFHVHTALGPGLLESIYETCLVMELESRQLRVERQVEVPIHYKGRLVTPSLRLDLLIEDCLIVELKAVERLLPVHKAQTITYLKLSGHHLGLLINFSVPRIKDGIERVIL